MRIRDATVEEAGALEALQRRSSAVWEQYRAALAAHPDAIAVPPALIRDHDARVAEDDEDATGRALGFSVVVTARRATCVLDSLFVEPDAMGRGIGRALVTDAVARAGARGLAAMEVVAGPATGFYERLGFRVVEPTMTRFGPAVRMRRAL